MIHLDAKKLGRFHQVGKRILNDGVHRNLKGSAVRVRSSALGFPTAMRFGSGQQ